METESRRSFIINVVYFAILAAAAAVIAKWGIPLLGPFVLAISIAYILRRPTKMIVKRFHLPYKPVAFALVLLFYATMGLLIALISIRAMGAVRTLVENLPHLYTVHIVPALSEIFTRAENFAYRMDANLFDLVSSYGQQLMSSLGSFVTDLSGRAVAAASSFAATIPGLFIQLVLMIISTFFIAADYNIIKAFLLRQLSSKGAELFVRVKEYLVGTLFVCIGSYFIIASLTFVELSIGLTLLRMQHPVLLAFLIAIFDILPVLGTGGIMVPWAVICLLRGNVPLGLGLLLLYVAITVIRNIVEPKIVGSQLGLHPVVTLASMYAGVQLFGVVGLFGFPIGLSLIRYLNDNGTIQVLK